jgi:hypothetical protein
MESAQGDTFLRERTHGLEAILRRPSDKGRHQVQADPVTAISKPLTNMRSWVRSYGLPLNSVQK